MKVKRIEMDPASGSAYVYFEDPAPGQAQRQVVLPGGMIFDLAGDGRILGIEILNPDVVSGLSEESVAEDLRRAKIPLVLPR